MKNQLITILIFTLFSLWIPSTVNAACPNLINGNDITITGSDNCSLTTGNTYLDKAITEASTTNTGNLTINSGGALTIVNGSTLHTPTFTVNTGGILYIQNGGIINIGGNNAPGFWVADGDADGYPFNLTTYTATAAGRRRLGLMKNTADCDDTNASIRTTNITGGNITTSGSDKIHTFTSSGTLNVLCAASGVNVLIVGGGGSGANSAGRGGGGGQVVYSTGNSLSVNSYSAVVGLANQSSSFNGVTAIAGYTGTASGNSGNNFAGGTWCSGCAAGPGGAGATTIGQSSSKYPVYYNGNIFDYDQHVGGNGGSGYTSNISGTSLMYGGGGGGGAYNQQDNVIAGSGASGAGNGGGRNQNGFAGTANRGGGGGGGYSGFSGGAGGSGVVIIRYPNP